MARVSFAEWLKRIGLAVLQLVLFVAVMIVGQLAVLWLAGGGRIRSLPGGGANVSPRVLDTVALLFGALLATWLVGVKLLRRSWRELGWPSLAPGPFARGVLTGVIMASVAIALALVGGARLSGDGALGGYVGVAGPLLVTFFAAALFEELIFRGFPLRRSAEVLGPWTATALISVAFAAAHLGNPAVTVLGVVNIALAGIWLSVAFFSPGGMRLAWGLHFGWNAMLCLGFDAPVSGLVFHIPGPEYTVGRWAWFDGGSFGPEGGLVATIALLAGTAYLLGDWGRRSREVKA
jgi:membrane protease YdiL (CAAX protease family)